MGLRKNSRPHQFLKGLAVGSGVLAISIISPVGGARLIQGLIGGYFRKKRFEKEIFLRDLKNLQSRKLVDYRELEHGNVEIKITKLGKETVLKYNLDGIKLKTQTWDGGWRLITFDIPNHHKAARDAFRKKLKDLKFYPLQKSVFLTPYPCEDEIDFVASIFDVRKYILILYIDHFEGEEKLRHHFKL
ncbi:MAG: hypothetical protein V1656_03320 [Candidatus Jorgensenbacteria bacterium]